MSELSNEHLQALTELINERLAEFGSNAAKLNGGVVRVAHDVIKKYYQEREEAWAMQRLSDVVMTAEMALRVSDLGYKNGYEAAKRATDNAEPLATVEEAAPLGAALLELGKGTEEQGA